MKSARRFALLACLAFTAIAACVGGTGPSLVVDSEGGPDQNLEGDSGLMRTDVDLGDPGTDRRPEYNEIERS